MNATILFIERLHAALLRIEDTTLLTHILDDEFGGTAGFKALAATARAEIAEAQMWRAVAEMQAYVAGETH